MPHVSEPELLVLHGVRVKGMTDAPAVATRFGLEPLVVEELLLDEEARGHVQRVSFADLSGWALTERGRAEDGRRLHAELECTGVRPAVAAANEVFAQLNGRFLATLTRWQIRPQPWDKMAANDHTDHRWDDRVLDDLERFAPRLRPVCDQLTSALQRFDGYADRFTAALERVLHGNRAWVDQTGIDSCHTVWIELHEDLLSTLALERGDDPRAG